MSKNVLLRIRNKQLIGFTRSKLQGNLKDKKKKKKSYKNTNLSPKLMNILKN